MQGRLCAGGRQAPALLCPCRGSSGVRNGLLVVNMLIDGHRGLAEQLAGRDLATVLQSCWWDGQSSSCPHAMLALGVINRLAEHQLPLGLETAGSCRPRPRLCYSPVGAAGRAASPARAEHPTGASPASGWAGPARRCPGRQRGPAGPEGRAAASEQRGGWHLVQGRGGGPGSAALQ